MRKSIYNSRRIGVYWIAVNETHQTDPDWRRRLYDEKAPELVLYGRALGLSHSESEDVLQDTFLAMMRKAIPPERPDHYCVRSFRNRALNFRRNVWRRIFREFESARWFERSDRCDALERAAMKCLERLPAPQREVIVLKIWHRYTFETIAELIEVSPNTVAGRYRYGIEKLNACLRKLDHEQLESFGESLAFLDSPTPLGKA